MHSFLKSARSFALAAAVGSLVAMGASTGAYAANPCAPNPCAGKKAPNPCAPNPCSPKGGNPCAPK